MTDDFHATMRSVALALYRSSSWQGLPWGPKQVLSGLIREVIDADVRAANERYEREKAEAERKMRERVKPKRVTDVPWE